MLFRQVKYVHPPTHTYCIITNRYAAHQQMQEHDAISVDSGKIHDDDSRRLIPPKLLVSTMLSSAGTSTYSKVAATAADSSAPSSVDQLMHSRSFISHSGVPMFVDGIGECQLKVKLPFNAIHVSIMSGLASFHPPGSRTAPTYYQSLSPELVDEINGILPCPNLPVHFYRSTRHLHNSVLSPPRRH